jgi:hypothetical protein
VANWKTTYESIHCFPDDRWGLEFLFVNGLGSVVQAKKVAEESVVVRWALRAANLLASDEQEEAAAAKSSERNTETNISGSLPASVESDLRRHSH